jgi:microcystin-dependent protein
MIINTDLVYPIGSIYLSVKNVNPSKYFGGTWTAWGSGRVPVGVDSNQTEFSTVEKTGGEKKHTLTINEIPSHNHNLPGRVLYYTAGGGEAFRELSGRDVAGNNSTSFDTGGGQSHNNLQPYITCYMWKRTA